MNKEKIQIAIDKRAKQLHRELMTGMEADIDWQVEQVEKILKEKKKVSRVYHELELVPNFPDMEKEKQFKDYLDHLNTTLAKILNIDYEYFDE